MYLHLDANTVIRTREIVAILDIENSSVSRITREFFAAARDQGGDHLPQRHRAAQVLPALPERRRGAGLCLPSGALHPAAPGGTRCGQPALTPQSPVLFPLLLPTGAGGGCFVYHLQPGRRAG